jgi:outer membrane protein assembly factor BamE (lipoprotein component of BamABCDE complex)
VKRVLALVMLAVLGIMLLTAADSCSKEINKNHTSDSDVDSKIRSQVSLGMSEPQVRSIMGKANHTQETNSAGYKNDCWYYGSSDSWQLCFDNGLVDHHPMSLTSKNRY